MYFDWNLTDMLGLLVILIWLVILTVRVMNGTRNKKAGMPALAGVSVARDGISEETVAAISAAVYAYMSETEPGALYRIAGISRTAGVRPVWGFAGMQQNTRPF